MLDGGKDRLARFHNNFLIIPPGTIKRWPIGSRFSCFLMGLVFFFGCSGHFRSDGADDCR